MRGIRASRMIRAVFDTNLFVSAFLTRENPGGVTSELLRFVIDGWIELYLSVEIADEVVATLWGSDRLRKRYLFSQEQVGQYRADLLTLATVVDDPAPTPGAVPRDPDDDKIIGKLPDLNLNIRKRAIGFGILARRHPSPKQAGQNDRGRDPDQIGRIQL